MLLFARFGDLRVGVQLGVLDNLVVSILNATNFTEWFMNLILPRELLRVHSILVLFAIVLAYVLAVYLTKTLCITEELLRLSTTSATVVGLAEQAVIPLNTQMWWKCTY